MPFITSQSMETCPRPITWGQKSQIRHDSIGSAIAPVAEKAEPKGLEVGVDYLCTTFHPPTDNPEQRQRVLEPAMPVRSPDGWEGSVYDTAGRHLAPVKDEEPPSPRCWAGSRRRCPEHWAVRLEIGCIRRLVCTGTGVPTSVRVVPVYCLPLPMIPTSTFCYPDKPARRYPRSGCGR